MGFKITPELAIGLILIVVVVGASGGLAGLRETGQEIISFDWLTGASGSGRVSVDKQLDLYLHNVYNGDAFGTKTLKVWDPDKNGFKESSLSTGADGTVNTAYPYASGRDLYVYYEDSNDKQWFRFTVPEMTPQDAEASTYNTVPLEGFTIGTYSTDSLKLVNGTSYADASTYNKTTDGATPVWRYGLANSGSDNTGVMASYDPSYNMRFDVVYYMTLSGTGYESVLVYGNFDYSFTLGSTQYYAKVLDPYKLTKHKVGWEYKSHGTEEVAYWMDLAGVTSGDSVTWQTYTYAYSDPAWCQDHGGDFGYEKVELAEHTVTITV